MKVDVQHGHPMTPDWEELQAWSHIAGFQMQVSYLMDKGGDHMIFFKKDDYHFCFEAHSTPDEIKKRLMEYVADPEMFRATRAKKPRGQRA